VKVIVETGNTHLALFLVRLWLGAMMLYHGGIKLFGGMGPFLDTVATKLHLSPIFGWAAALTEFLGGACIVFGFLTRPAAAGIAVIMAVAAFGVHATDAWPRKEFALCYFIFATVLIIAGAGRFSVDSLIATRLSLVTHHEIGKCRSL
jgi:putative oxidoreductase